MLKIIERAAKKSGGIVALAAKLGVRHQTLYSWKQVPPEHVLKLEQISGVSRHKLRPDLSKIFVEAAPDAPTQEVA